MPEALSRPARTVAALLRVSLMTAMQYRANFLLDALTGLVRNTARVAPLLLVYVHRDEVAGWDLPRAMLVMAFFLVLVAVQEALLEPNLGEAVEAIRTGALDLVLMKPADAQLLVSLRRVEPSGVWELGAAGVLAGWSFRHLPPPGALDLVVAAGLLACGLAAVYGLWLIAICTSFWFVRVDNLRFLLWSASEAGRWPVTVFSGWVRIALTAVIPVAVVTTLPVVALTGAWTLRTVAIGVAVGAGFLAVSRLAWRRSLAAYTSASS